MSEGVCFDYEKPLPVVIHALPLQVAQANLDAYDRLMLQRRTPLAPRRKRKRMIKPERVVDPAHLAKVATLPCLVCCAMGVEGHRTEHAKIGSGGHPLRCP